MAVDCAALADAISRGVRKVKTGDDEVEYRDLDEMIKIHELFCGPIVPPDAETTNTPSLATSYASFCKRGVR